MDLVSLFFEHGDWIVYALVLIALSLSAINQGRDLFDVLDGSARIENSWIDFKFSLMTYAFGAVIVGGTIWLLMVGLQSGGPTVSMMPSMRSGTEVSRTVSSPKKTKSHSRKHHPAH